MDGKNSEKNVISSSLSMQIMELTIKCEQTHKIQYKYKPYIHDLRA